MNELPRLRTLRQQRLLTLRDLAKAAGVAKDTILRIEQGATARPGTVRKLATALGVEPGDLIGPMRE